MKFKSLTAIACAGIIAAAVATPVVAQSMMKMGDDAIAARKDGMKTLGGTMRTAGSMTGADAVKVGETLVATVTELKDYWPDDSKTGDTKALEGIWNADGSLSEGFVTAYTNSLNAAEAVLAAANAGDAAAYGDALKAMGGTCGACHGTFRAK